MDSKGKEKAKCRLCGKEGHLPEACPTPNALKTCNICKKKGHLAKTCPTPEVNIICNQCRRKGHSVKNCNIIIWDTPKYVRCSYCNEEKHDVRNCPLKKQRDEKASNQPRATSPINSTSSSSPSPSSPPSTSPSPSPVPPSATPSAPSTSISSSSSLLSSVTSSIPSPSLSRGAPVAPAGAIKRKDDPKILEMEKHLHGTVRARQIRLDFHTSEHLPELASDFDATKFARSFKSAFVDSVTVTARCHHGLLYFQSSKHPDSVHPSLKSNLLVEQVKALHKVGIRAPVAVSVGWDQLNASRHPEWLSIPSHTRAESHEPVFYKLCLNSPYREHVRQIVEEIVLTLEAARHEGGGFDGIYFDGVQAQNCSCGACLAGVKERGGDGENESDRLAFGARLVSKFREEIAALVKRTFQLARFGKQIPKQKKKTFSLSFNGGLVGPKDRRLYESVVSHIDVISPSLELPARLRYARGLDVDAVATISSGSYHSFSSPDTLSFETSRALSLGAKCNIVDQLHPRGQLNEYKYEEVKRVYEEVEKKEGWCGKVLALVEAAVLSSEEFSDDFSPTLGATAILESLGYQFDVIDSLSNFSRYKLIILPDSIPVDDKLSSKLENFLDLGGAVIASGSSGLDAIKSKVTLKSIGVQLVGPAEFSPDFILPGNNAIGNNLPPTEHVMFTGGWKVKASSFSLVKEERKEEPAHEKEKEREEENGDVDGDGDEGEEEKEKEVKKETLASKVANGVPAVPVGTITEYSSEVLATIVEPYFNRTWDHFTSDTYTPSSGKVAGPAVVFTPKRRVVYFTHNIFSQFWLHSSPWVSKLVENAVKLLLPERIITTPGSPSTLLTSVTHNGKSKYVIHLLHYAARRIGASNNIADAVPLHNVKVELRIPGLDNKNNKKGESGYVLELALAGTPIDFEKKEGGEISFVVPVVAGHQIVCLTVK